MHSQSALVEATSKFLMLQMKALIPGRAFIFRVGQSCGFLFSFSFLSDCPLHPVYVLEIDDMDCFKLQDFNKILTNCMPPKLQFDFRK